MSLAARIQQVIVGQNDIKGAGFDKTTDTLENIRDELTAIEGTGFSTGTDSLAKLREAIEAYMGLTAKQASLLGAGAFKGFQDYFGDGGTANAIKSAYWTEITSGTTPGTITIRTDVSGAPPYVELYSGADLDDYALIHGDGKYSISPYESDITTVHMKFCMRLSSVGTADDMVAWCGLQRGTYTGPDDYARVVKDNNGVRFLTSDGVSSEWTALSLSANTWYTFEICWTTSDVKLYQDGSLVATHTAYLPLRPLHVAAVAYNAGGAITLDVAYVQLWAE
jgi:hypothetical protein